MNQFPWLIRRELWENRAVWLVPAVIGGFLLIAALFGTIHVDFSGPDLRQALAPGPVAEHMLGGMMLVTIAGLFLAVMGLYSSWYLLDCLHGERKDRSILFWKSLPISDTATVLSKLCMGLVVIPVAYWLFADIASLLTAFVLSVRSRSLFTAGLWQIVPWLQVQGLWLYGIVTLAIWYLPVAGWLLLVSAWAKRAVLLWSLLPPLGVIAAERLLLGTHACADLIANRLLHGYVTAAFHGGLLSAGFMMSGLDSGAGGNGHDTAALASPLTAMWHALDPIAFVVAPATWTGLVLGCLLLVLTIQVRMRRTEL